MQQTLPWQLFLEPATKVTNVTKSEPPMLPARFPSSQLEKALTLGHLRPLQRG